MFKVLKIIDEPKILELVVFILSIVVSIFSFKPYCYLFFASVKIPLYFKDALIDIPSAKVLYIVPLTISALSLLSLLNIKKISWRSSYYVMSSFLGVIVGSLAVGDLQGSSTFILNEFGPLIAIKYTDFFVFFILMYVMIAFVGLLQYKIEKGGSKNA